MISTQTAILTVILILAFALAVFCLQHMVITYSKRRISRAEGHALILRRHMVRAAQTLNAIGDKTKSVKMHSLLLDVQADLEKFASEPYSILQAREARPSVLKKFEPDKEFETAPADGSCEEDCDDCTQPDIACKEE